MLNDRLLKSSESFESHHYLPIFICKHFNNIVVTNSTDPIFITMQIGNILKQILPIHAQINSCSQLL